MRRSCGSSPRGVIPGRRHREVPICWEWEPPDAAQWAYARRGDDGDVLDEEDAAFRLLVRWCRYRCTICGRSDPDCRVVMDHDHRTGLCRGILCRDCNRIEGFGGGPAFRCYRERNPADICGVKVWYWPSSLGLASPEIVDFWSELRLYARDGDRRPRDGKRWMLAEERIASRDDLTDEEVARITGRTASGVARRRASLAIDLPDIDAWW